MGQFIGPLHKSSFSSISRNFWVTLVLFAVTGCGSYSSPNSLMDEQISATEEQCRKKLADGQYKKASEMLEQCLSPARISAYRAYHSNILSNKFEAMELYQVKLLKQVEKGTLSEQASAQKMQEFEAKLDEKNSAHERAVNAAEAKRQQLAAERHLKEQAKLARYYKEHPYEAEQLALQRRQVEALEANNRLQLEESIAAQKRASEERWRQLFRESAQIPRSTSCTTNYSGSTAYTSCW